MGVRARWRRGERKWDGGGRNWGMEEKTVYEKGKKVGKGRKLGHGKELV